MPPAAPSWTRRGDRSEVVLPSAGRAVGSGGVDGLLAATREILADPALEGSEIHLVADHPADADDQTAEAVADALGFTRQRTLHQLRRSLPILADDPSRAGLPVPALRPFTAADADAWIRVNNRAFARHPDQGAETPETFAARRAEPWFDPDGFLVVDDVDRPGDLAGFCWTKVHPVDPTTGAPAGEIYVIGADPTQHGRGMGAALVLGGLDHLTSIGLGDAFLFVEADNGPARRLYGRLGFTTAGRRAVYAR